MNIQKGFKLPHQPQQQSTVEHISLRIHKTDCIAYLYYAVETGWFYFELYFSREDTGNTFICRLYDTLGSWQLYSYSGTIRTNCLKLIIAEIKISFECKLKD